MIRSSVSLGMGLALALLAVTPAWSSSHREAPNITKMPKVDNTDLYAFRSYEPGRGAFTTIIANFQPGENPGDGPNYYTMDPDALYEIMIDSDGDAKEDLTYQFRFFNSLQNGTGVQVNVGGKTLPIALRHAGPVTTTTDPDLGEYEYFTITQVQGDRRTGASSLVRNHNFMSNSFAKPFDYAGAKTNRSYHYDYTDRGFMPSIEIPGCDVVDRGRVFVGQRGEQFAVNLGPIFDLVNFIPIQGAPDPVYGSGTPFPGGITQSEANQELIGKKNVTSIAIELPTACITGNGNGVIGVWSSVSLPRTRVLSPNPTYLAPDSTSGGYVQVSRLGNPLVNEFMIGLPDKDRFNAVNPTADAALADYVTNPTFPAILNTVFRDQVRSVIGGSGTIAPTNFPRNDLVAVYLTGIKSLNQMSTVTSSEMLRLNTLIPPTPLQQQRVLGVVADDFAGFPNGRRPYDDVVDITLRFAMGRLCHPFPINTVPTQLGLCSPSDAPTGLAAYTDGAPSIINGNFLTSGPYFPYLARPLRGSPRPQTEP